MRIGKYPRSLIGNMDEKDECTQKASSFLQNNKQNNLWGYNTDWSYDFDSTTFALNTLNVQFKNEGSLDILDYQSIKVDILVPFLAPWVSI